MVTIVSSNIGGAAAPVVAFKNITKRFGAHLALRDVSFAVQHREILAVLGDNGAGKSTLVKRRKRAYTRLTRARYASKGTALSIRSPSHARELGIGVVYQDLALFDNLGAAENLYAGHEVCESAQAGQPRISSDAGDEPQRSGHIRAARGAYPESAYAGRSHVWGSGRRSRSRRPSRSRRASWSWTSPPQRLGCGSGEMFWR